MSPVCTTLTESIGSCCAWSGLWSLTSQASIPGGPSPCRPTRRLGSETLAMPGHSRNDDRAAGSAIDSIATHLCGVLAAMFGDPGLKRLRRTKPAHPAVRQFETFEDLRAEEAALMPSQGGLVLDLLRSLLDYDLWASPQAADDFWSFLPDDTTRRRTRAVIEHAEQFADVIAELFFWSWLRRSGFDAERVEAEGISDIVIDLGDPREVRAEVKRLRTSTAGRIGEVVKTANQQIRRSAPPGGGILFVLLDIPMRPGADEVPLEVAYYVDEFTRTTRHQNSSVGHVVVTWDDFDERGEYPDPVTVTVRRRSVVVKHGAPRVVSAIAAREISVHASVSSTAAPSQVHLVKQSPEQLLRDLKKVTLSDRGLGGVPPSVNVARGLDRRQGALRRSHAIDAFKSPDGCVVHQMPDGLRAVVTKRVTTRETDSVLVLRPALRGDPPHWRVALGWRLYGDAEELDGLQGRPNEAFATVLERYGIRFHTGVGMAWWAPELQIQLAIPSGIALDPEWVPRAVMAATGITSRNGGHYLTFQGVRVSGSHEVTLADVYFVSEDRYRAAVIRASRRN